MPAIMDEVECRESVRAELGTSEDAVVIAQVSRMEEGKGHRVHLKALALLRNVASWTCWFVGGAQTDTELRYVAELRETAKRLRIADRVRFVGARTDVPRILTAADIFCHPNTVPEGFGIVFIEALDAGRPVVTSAIGGALEIIDRSTGFLVKPNKPAELATALRLLIESADLRWDMGLFGPSRARELCSPRGQMEALRNAAISVTV
jgi:glycosyltransferase involved in cell wall biosynthesis